ncbi:unnamed protein product [marine sediment metagenome]|uniref:Uncharacterized protein n=1 Tax=marine sediment metagenome TaxID=412755 RepID=X0YE40_9ZZZZ
MNKSDYVYMVLDNVLVFNINLPPEFQNNGLNDHLNKFDENYVKIIAGFNKNFLEHFLTISKGKYQNDIADLLKKMEKIAYMVGPIGNLSYLGSDQVDHILTKINDLKIDEIIEEKISLVADDQLPIPDSDVLDAKFVPFEDLKNYKLSESLIELLKQLKIGY